MMTAQHLRPVKTVDVYRHRLSVRIMPAVRLICAFPLGHVCPSSLNVRPMLIAALTSVVVTAGVKRSHITLCVPLMMNVKMGLFATSYVDCLILHAMTQLSVSPRKNVLTEFAAVCAAMIEDVSMGKHVTI